MNHLYEILARLIEYPADDWNTPVERWEQRLTTEGDEVPPQLVELRRKLRDLPIESLQELYTRTFDLNPVCTLDIGYHLFGENYKRGELLAGLRETEAPFELGQQNQLPDYLPVLLRLLVKLEDQELRESLIVELLIPALSKMLQSLDDANNPYRYLIQAIDTELRNDASEVQTDLSKRDATAVPELYRISSRTAARP